MDEDEDPVVAEYPVYMCRSLAQSLFVLQYPTKATTLGKHQKDEPVLEVKYKPKQHRLSMKIALDTSSRTFDLGRAEELAMNMEKVGIEDEASQKDKMMDYKVIEGTGCTKDTRRYALGRFTDSGIHLAPLDAWFCMRPEFSHVDKAASAGVGADVGDKKDPDAEDTVKNEDGEVVSIRFARHQTDRAKRAEQRSFAFLQKASESEPWCAVDFIPRGCDEAASIRRNMVAVNFGSVADAMEVDDEVMDTKQILDGKRRVYESESVFVEGIFSDIAASDAAAAAPPPPQPGPPGDKKGAPGPATTGTAISKVPLSNLPMQLLRSRPLNDRVTAIASRAKIARFDEICTLLRPEPESSILRSLMSCCYLVQGCWVVRSDQIYKSSSNSKHSNSVCRGVPLDLMARARDFILYHFFKSRVVEKSQLKNILKLPPADLTRLIREMAKPTEKNGDSYEFMFPTDTAFTSKYPDVYERQVILWNAKYEQLMRLMKNDEVRTHQGSESGGSPTSSPRQQRRRGRTRSQRESISSDVEPSASSGAGR